MSPLWAALRQAMRLTVRGTLRFVGVIVDQNVRCRTASTPVLTIRCDVAFWPGATDVVLQQNVGFRGKSRSGRHLLDMTQMT
jgi:hypothetical protein